MKILESPLLKNRIALGCIGLLGLSTFSGLMHTSSKSGLFTTLSKFFGGFGSSGSVAPVGPLGGAEGKISPIQWVSKQGKEAWNEYITPFAVTAYTWVREKDKRDSVWGALKKFWNYGFFKGLMSNLPWIVLAWVKIVTNGEARSKLFLAWKYSLNFFDLITKNQKFKTHSPSFGRVFAELLFKPQEAITRFMPRGCEAGAGAARGEKETSICMSVKYEKSK